jgi:hypothetical protein
LKREGYSSTAAVRGALAVYEVHVVVVGQDSIAAQCRNVPKELRDDKQKAAGLDYGSPLDSTEAVSSPLM